MDITIVCDGIAESGSQVKDLPRVGDFFETDQGIYKVTDVMFNAKDGNNGEILVFVVCATTKECKRLTYTQSVR